MSVGGGYVGRERPSLRVVAAGLAVALVAALAGLFLASRIAADPAPEPVDVQRVLTAGPARLKVTGGWQEARSATPVPGLAGGGAFTPYAGLTTTVSVALVEAEHPSLLPSELVAAVAPGKLPVAEPARVVGLDARAYRDVPVGAAVLDVYAIPTTRGVLTLACAAASGGRAPARCLRGVDQITVAGAQPVRIDDATAYRMRASAVLSPLDALRVQQRVALRRAKGPRGQQRAARTLWRAYAAAAGELSTLVVPDSAQAGVVTSLRDAARAYRALGAAADRRSRRAWARARTDASRAEKTLAARVAAA
jgi:hypothetical protein